MCFSRLPHLLSLLSAVPRIPMPEHLDGTNEYEMDAWTGLGIYETAHTKLLYGHLRARLSRAAGFNYEKGLGEGVINHIFFTVASKLGLRVIVGKK